MEFQYSAIYKITNETKFEKLLRDEYENNFDDFSRCEEQWTDVDFDEIEKIFTVAHKVAVDMKDADKIKYCDLNNIVRILETGHVVWAPFAIYRIKTDDAKCPLCGCSFSNEKAAISRRDNKTYICSDCGLNEAIEDIAIDG